MGRDRGSELFSMETERGPMSRSCHVAAVAGVVAGAGEPDPAAARLPNHTVCEDRADAYLTDHRFLILA